MLLNILFYCVIIVVILRWVFGDENKKKQQLQNAEEKAAAQPTAVSVKIIQQRKPARSLLRECGSGGWLKYSGYSCSSVKLAWENPETGEERVPENRTCELTTGSAFCAAGRKYTGFKALKHEKLENDRWKDIYGREWFNLNERYPCFDSEDYLNEKRFYRWYFLQDGDCITRVFDNGRGNLFVTDDVGEIERECLQEMKKTGYLLCPEDARP